MADLSKITEHLEVISADGARVGTVDEVEGARIKLTRAASGSHRDHHHYISGGLLAAVDGNAVRLSATGASAALLEEEEGGEPLIRRHVPPTRRCDVMSTLRLGSHALCVRTSARFRQLRSSCNVAANFIRLSRPTEEPSLTEFAPH